jgi:hypothetical protein
MKDVFENPFLPAFSATCIGIAVGYVFGWPYGVITLFSLEWVYAVALRVAVVIKSK